MIYHPVLQTRLLPTCADLSLVLNAAPYMYVHCTKLSMTGLHFNSVILFLLCQFYGSYNLSPTEICLLTANITPFMTNSPQFTQNNFNPLHL